MLKPAFRLAQHRDVEPLLDMMREFCAFGEPLPYDRESRRAMLAEFIVNQALGRLWLIELDAKPIGYVVVAFGYSFEHQGRDAFIDELFVQSGLRGRGIGRQTLEFLLQAAAELGVRALHLEVDHDNPAAERLYRSSGFEGNRRALLTKRLGE